MQLRRFLAFQFAAVAAVPVILITVFISIQLIPGIQINIRNQQQAMARAIAGQVAAQLQGGERQLKSAVTFIDAAEGLDSDQRTALLDSLCSEGRFFETIYTMHAEDMVVDQVGLTPSRQRNREDLLGVDLSGRAFITDSMSSPGAVWSETFLSTVSSSLAVALIVRSSDLLYIGEVTLSKMSDLISHLPAETGFLVLVLDRQGRIVADSRRLHAGLHADFSLMSDDETRGSRPRTANLVIGEVPVLAVTVGVEPIDWSVVVAQPVNIALGPVRSAYIAILTGLAAGFAVALGIAWFIARLLFRSFQAYAEAVRDIAEGDYEVRLGETRISEISFLTENLAHMAEMIRDRERALIENENRTLVTLNSIGDAVIATDAEGTITRINPAASLLTGWSSDDAAGETLETVFRIVDSDTGIPAKNPAKDVLESGESVDLSSRTVLVSRDGTEYEIAAGVAPIRHADGRIDGVVLVFRDVTEKNRIAEMMVQSEKMLSVGGLAAGMAHEINNPLSGIVQTAQVIEGRLGTGSDIRANIQAAEAAGTTVEAVNAYMSERGILRMIETVKASASRVAAIVENMLGFARKNEGSFSTHDIGELIEKTLELAATDYNLKKRYDFRAIEIVKDFEKDLPPVPCQEGKIQQVLLNILGNGAAAMQDSENTPRFVIRARREQRSYPGSGPSGGRDMVRIEIEDNGPGMDEETRKRVFEPFFTTKPVGIGTGLGLSVSYFIIRENHDGELSVESTPGSGARFIISLPVGEKPATRR